MPAIKPVDFNDTETEEKAQQRKNLKDLFYKLSEGDNTVRFIDFKGVSAVTHWVQNTSDKWLSVKCPETGCPCCDKEVQKQYKTFMKVVDEVGKIKILEFGPQIKRQLKEQLKKLKEKNPDAIATQMDFNIHRAPKGTNPLYTVGIVDDIDADQKELKDKVVSKAVANDDLNLEEVITPWTPESINKYIYGIGDDGSSSDSFAGNQSDETPSAPDEKTASASAESSGSSDSEEDEEDMSIFD